ncbi:hypothetical protein [Streptomyces sp. NPDC047525]|uniref:hypothetical protein n=1 Tax=Streptomyces sp. NPDC047525 TaxID=3155264 RepID=UPI0033E52160
MTYLVLDHGWVTSAHACLESARAAETQGLGPSDEAGPLLDGDPAWWLRAGSQDDASGIGLVRTEATSLGIRFELRACQAPSGTCDHRPCAFFATWAVSSSFRLLSAFTALVPTSGIWAGLRSHEPRGDDPAFLSEAQALIEKLNADLRPPLRAVGHTNIDARTLEERRHAAHGHVVRFLARQFGPSTDRPASAKVRPLLDGINLHLTLQPPSAEAAALCGVPLQDQQQTTTRAVSGVSQCDQCFGRAPISPSPVLTAAEHDAWTAYLHAPYPLEP